MEKQTIEELKARIEDLEKELEEMSEAYYRIKLGDNYYNDPIYAS